MNGVAGSTRIEIPQRVLDRAAGRHVVDPSGCWISTYAIGSHGYAQVGWWADGKSHMITHHRAAWTAVHGPVPEGMTIDHICQIRRCVNPDHLRLLTPEVNGRRAGRDILDAPAGECLHGHGPDAMREITRTRNGRTIRAVRCAECHRLTSKGTKK